MSVTGSNADYRGMIKPSEQAAVLSYLLKGFGVSTGVASDLSKEVKAIAEANGWNPNNASIEYYQWRKFNGITGRVAKAAPAQAEVEAEVETKVEGE